MMVLLLTTMILGIEFIYKNFFVIVDCETCAQDTKF